MGISIITNFGCGYDCPYCIWKGHPLEHRHDETDWEKLESFLRKGREMGFDHVSVSGGGDPLYRFGKHASWWLELHRICREAHLYIDVHTHERPMPKDHAWDFLHTYIRRLVMSSDTISDVWPYANSDDCPTPYRRIVHVVTANDKMGDLLAYARACCGKSVSLSFKKLHGGQDGGLWEKAKADLSGWDICFIHDRDYNVYFMPDNTVKHAFLPRGGGAWE